jgi:plasmid maintenance system antidote protein VapI
MIETLSDILRKQIQESGASINYIAVRSEIPVPVLWRFVRGERDLTLRTATKLARYLGLEMRPKPAESA